ncbi:MAG: DNA replication/repair protein RecF [Porticoccaceae bacterium]|nr:MAG: DNA replication/repair protein RecF [Porticoccaceae bacterium]
MHLQRLDVHGLRNLRHVQLSLSPGANIFYGSNGGGKTSLLEALHVLGRGRSFRCRTLNPIINQNEDSCTVFGLLEKEGKNIPLGVSRSRKGGFQFKVNGQLIHNASSLAEAMPLLVLNADSFRLLDGGPQYRRQYVDWGVFHVEHNYRLLWQKFRRALKQRNSLLRHDRIDEVLLGVWDAEFSGLADQINQYRQQYLLELIPKIQWVIEELTLLQGFEFKHYAGWDVAKPLKDILLASRQRDFQLKGTQYGPHRADLRIRFNNQPASDVLSRGQIKILVTAMQIAQGFLFYERTGCQCLYLLDDLPSELDVQHREKVGKLLYRLGAQTFITGVVRDDVVLSWPGDSKQTSMFHVEHGGITPE